MKITISLIRSLLLAFKHVVRVIVNNTHISGFISYLHREHSVYDNDKQLIVRREHNLCLL